MGNYIEGFDVYNSLLLNALLDPNLQRTPYRITKFEYRPELIAQEIYGSQDYAALLMITTGKKVSEFVIGEVLQIIPKSIVDDIISNI